MRYRLVALDIDGTIRSNEHPLSARTRIAIQRILIVDRSGSSARFLSPCAIEDDSLDATLTAPVRGDCRSRAQSATSNKNDGGNRERQGYGPGLTSLGEIRSSPRPGRGVPECAKLRLIGCEKAHRCGISRPPRRLCCRYPLESAPFFWISMAR